MTIRKRDIRWLEMCKGHAGMYPGERQDMIPVSVSIRLERAGFIIPWFPHNEVHKERWVITSEGEAYLEKEKAGKI